MQSQYLKFYIRFSQCCGCRFFHCCVGIYYCIEAENILCPNRSSGILILLPTKQREWLYFSFLTNNQLAKGKFSPSVNLVAVQRKNAREIIRYVTLSIITQTLTSSGIARKLKNIYLHGSCFSELSC